MLTQRRQKLIIRSVPFIILFALTVLVFPTMSQEAPEVTATPTAVQDEIVPEATREVESMQNVDVDSNAPESTPEVEEETEATATPSVTPTPKVIVPEATTESDDDEVSPESTAEFELEMPGELGGGIIMPMFVQTHCYMDINANNDTNPFTFGFNVGGHANIASFQWDFDYDGSTFTADASGVGPHAHTYSSVGNKTVMLRCTPEAGFGSTIELTGTVSIFPTPVASFTVAASGPVGAPPITYTATNTSTEGAVYDWTVTDSTNAPICSATTTTVSAPFSCPLPAFGVYRYNLTATMPGGLDSTAYVDVNYNPPPKVHFTFTPVSGEVPLNVSATAVIAADSGPINVNDIEWDFEYNGSSFSVDASGLTANYTYIAEGTYTIRMRYSGPGGGGWQEEQLLVVAPDEDLFTSFTYYLTGNNSGGQIEVCFVNTTVGTYSWVEWDWNWANDPAEPFDEINNSSVVCRFFTASPTSFRVRMRAYVDATFYGEANDIVNITAAPTANFTISPTGSGQPYVNQTYTLDGTSGNPGGSIGNITTYSWDTNGDGVDDATGPVITGSQPAPGTYNYRLTVTGPGGSSSVEKIVVVSYQTATCPITGTFTQIPGSGTHNYTVNLGSLQDRTVASYAWRATDAANVLHTDSAPTFGYNVTGAVSPVFLSLEVTLSDGSICQSTGTININYPPLTCDISKIGGDMDGMQIYPVNTHNGNFVGSVTDSSGNLNGRTIASENITIFRNGSGTATPGNTAVFTNDTIPTPTSVIDWRVYYEVTLSDGSSCFDEVNFETIPYPINPTCAITGSTNPIPNIGSSTGVQTYTVAVTDAANRPFTVNASPNGWVITGTGALGAVTGTTATTATIEWPLDTATVSYSNTITVNLTIVNANGDEASVPVSCTLNVTPTVPGPTCATPTGDIDPVYMETTSYTPSIGSLYGRAITSVEWTLRRTSPTPIVNQTYSGTNPQAWMSEFLFNEANAVYRLSYVASVAGPADSCTSGELQISTLSATQNFSCDAFPNAFTDGGTAYNNFNPLNMALSYPYRIDIDNGNAIDLRYTYRLFGIGEDPVSGVGTVIATYTSTSDAIVPLPAPYSAGFDWATLAPLGIGRYTLRVDVEAVDPLVSSHQCSLSRTLVMGELDAQYTYTINDPTGTPRTNSAMPVNAPICITNTSTATGNNTPGTHATNLRYDWVITRTSGHGDETDNSLGATTFSTDTPNLPDCISFGTPGSYRIRLHAANDYGSDTTFRLEDNHDVTFNVYGLHEITITRQDSHSFVNNTVSFTAGENHLDNGYSWTVTNLSTMATHSTHTSTLGSPDISFYMDATTAGTTYRVTVTGSGPLGTVTAYRDFTLLATDRIAARFTRTPAKALAPAEVCFTDHSTTNAPYTINSWTWNFGDGTTSTSQNPCHTYSAPGRYVVTLSAGNTAGNTAVASNITQLVTLGGADFSYQYTGNGGTWCFTPINIAAGVQVTSWDFGDGSTPVTVNHNGQVCHDYSFDTNPACFYGITMNYDNPAGTSPATDYAYNEIPCYRPGVPVLAMSAVCSATQTATFTVTNTGDNMDVTDYISIHDNSGNLVLYAPVLINAGTPAVFTVANQLHTLSGSLLNGTSANANTYCFQAPTLSIAHTCGLDGSTAFTITNNSVDTAANQPYTVANGSTTVASGTLTIPANGGTQVVNVSDFGPLDFASSSATYGTLADVTGSSDCNHPPVISVAAACLITGQAEFTVTNNSPDTDANQSYTITNSGGTVATGTVTALANGGTEVFTATGDYLPLTFTTSSSPQGGTAAATANIDCDTPPLLSAAVACAAGTTSFTITNSSPNTAASQPYQVLSGSTVIDSGTLTIPTGGSQVIHVASYDPLTFSSSGPQGDTTVIAENADCDDRAPLGVEPVCAANGVGSFVVTNYNEPMTGPQPYSIVSSLNQSVITSGTIQLGHHESTTITVSGDVSDGVIFKASVFDLPVSTLLACGSELPTGPRNFFSGLTSAGNGIQASSCGRGCPVFKMYHTDEVGGWEIFRLDGANQQERTSIRENLSLGLDDTVTNMSPSLSPDNNWVVFASDRDGNWEIYVAPTSGGNPDAVRRVTFNTVAIDSDPVWGPNNWVVFETTRHGNWDLYAIDMETGNEYRLTDSLGNDINPFWSPEGDKLVFQSDRADENGVRKWQIYELELATLGLTKLSDGSSTDVEPEYSNRGDKIAFRSYESSDTNSVLSIMNSDGSNRVIFSDANGDATNVAWSPNDTYIAYQSDVDGDLDIYVYEVATRQTRQLTGNDIPDYAPTWLCDDVHLVWSSDITDDPNIFEAIVTPISGAPIDVLEDADQMTFELSNDIYPLSSPAEENASREGGTVRGAFGEQTVFLQPNVSLTPIDLSQDGITRPLWDRINACPAR